MLTNTKYQENYASINQFYTMTTAKYLTPWVFSDYFFICIFSDKTLFNVLNVLWSPTFALYRLVIGVIVYSTEVADI